MDKEEFLIQWTNYEGNKVISLCSAYLIDGLLFIEPHFYEKPIFSSVGIVVPIEILKEIIKKLNDNELL